MLSLVRLLLLLLEVVHDSSVFCGGGPRPGQGCYACGMRRVWAGGRVGVVVVGQQDCAVGARLVSLVGVVWLEYVGWFR